jgi:enoyl-CoA hydratase/carnithine racemase
VVIATLDNPPHGLMNAEIVAGLDALVGEVEGDAGIGAVVLHGAHPERFLAHYDVGELLAVGEAGGVTVSRRQADVALRALRTLTRVPGAASAVEGTPAAGMLALQRFHELLLRMNRVGATFIAALNGSAMGGGCELALACDLRYMADGDFVIGQPEILLGIIPGGGGTQRLARLLGSGRALELTLEGSALSPAQALEIGLVNRVLAPELLLEEAVESATRLARRPRVAVAAAKRAIYEGGSAPLAAGLHAEAASFMSAVTSPAGAKGMRAYVDGLHETGELPGYDAAARARLLDGTYVDLNEE